MAGEQDEVARSLTELLAIAKLAMPDFLFEMDPRVHRARRLIGAISQVSESRPPSVLPAPTDMLALTPSPTMGDSLCGDTAPWDITAGLDALMAEPDAPTTRTEAVIMVLRDWFVGHGYLSLQPPDEEWH